MIIFGVDPGLSGSVAAVGEGIAAAIPFEQSNAGTLDFKAIAAFLDSFKQFECRAFVEAVHAFHKQGVSSAFTFGRTTGHIEGFLLGRGIMVSRVLPKVWQDSMYLKLRPELEGKERSIQAVKALYPDISIRRTVRTTTDHSGMADALLIATYGHRLLSLAKLK